MSVLAPPWVTAPPLEMVLEPSRMASMLAMTVAAVAFSRSNPRNASL